MVSVHLWFARRFHRLVSVGIHLSQEIRPYARYFRGDMDRSVKHLSHILRDDGKESLFNLHRSDSTTDIRSSLVLI